MSSGAEPGPRAAQTRRPHRALIPHPPTVRTRAVAPRRSREPPPHDRALREAVGFMTRLRVAAVVVTYNRRAVLPETLHAIQAQTHPTDRLYVVDNASEDSTPDLLRTEFPDAKHIRLGENLGHTGGLARGIAAARDDGFDAYWLLDDDSSPDVDALDMLLAALRDDGPSGIV